MTKREYLCHLVDEKNRCSRPLTDEERAFGFLGWHERGYLPHCDFPGLIQFVTFRLADSMPTSRRGEWEHLLAIEDVREKRAKLEEYLDRGLGECLLRDPQMARPTEETLLDSHDRECGLLAWCVMPNHVHVLLHVWQKPLWKLVKSWKVHVAFEAKRAGLECQTPVRREESASADTPNRGSALQSRFWQREYWDTFMRNEEQERKAIHYIENNPVKAKLCRTAEEWAFSSARWWDAYRRLVLPARQPAH
jgi:putative transposase